MKPILRNIHNNEIYTWDGSIFINIRTGAFGSVETEKAQKTFRFNVEATQMIFDNPEIEEMIKVLNLKFDNNLKNEK